MIVVKNKFIPFEGYETINLFGVLFTRGDVDRYEYNHENIHTYQIIECMIFGAIIIAANCLMFNISWWWLILAIPVYYIQYGLEYIIIRCFHKKQGDAYHDVSFEEEAHAHGNNLNYLTYRKPFAWIKYLKLKSN